MTFVYDPGVSASDRTIIETSLANGQTYLASTLGRSVQRAVTVTVRDSDGPFTASAGGSAITVYTRHEGWRVVASLGRAKTMVHELFHILQEEVAWPGPRGGWLHEGSAEYTGYAAVVTWGMASYSEVQACEIGGYFGADGPSAPALEALSFEPTSPVRGRYLIAWLAWDQILRGPSGVPRLSSYWRNGFAAAFGESEADFYQRFVEYRRSLRAPAGDPCAPLRSR